MTVAQRALQPFGRSGRHLMYGSTVKARPQAARPPWSVPRDRGASGALRDHLQAHQSCYLPDRTSPGQLPGRAAPPRTPFFGGGTACGVGQHQIALPVDGSIKPPMARRLSSAPPPPPPPRGAPGGNRPRGRFRSGVRRQAGPA